MLTTNKQLIKKFRSMNKIIKILLYYIIVNICIVNCYNKAVSQPLYKPASGPFYEIVYSGKANAQIVIPVEPSFVEKYAASELQSYFEKISDVQLPIIKEGDKLKYSFSLLLGDTKKAMDTGIQLNEEKVGSDGFEIKSLPGNKGLIIRGRYDLGTLFGVYELLERYFDVRWFMPGEEFYPKNTTLEIGKINLVHKPSFAVRWVGTGEWALNNRMNSYVKIKDHNVGVEWKWGFHTFIKLMPPEKYYEEHPEYFAMVDGKRSITDSRTHENQLCTSNPDVIREVANNLIDTLNANPSIDIISLSPNDGGGFCECENCRKLDEPGRDWFAQTSNRLAVFNRDVSALVKKKHPDVLIKVGAYASYLRPPLNPDFRPEDNQIIQVCHLWGGCHNHPLGSNKCVEGKTFIPNERFLPNQDFEKILDQWLDLSSHVFVYEYYWINSMHRPDIVGTPMPWPLIHAIKSDIPYYRDKGVKGFYTQLSNETFYRLGLNYYLAVKLAWNADLNVDNLLDDYFEKFYGPSAKPCKDYFMCMEKSMQDWNGCASYGYPGYNELPIQIGLKVFTPTVMKQLEESIIKAEFLSSGDKTASRRVAMVRKMFDETKESLKEIKLIE